MPSTKKPPNKNLTIGQRLEQAIGDRTIEEVVQGSGVSRRALYDYTHDISEPTPRIQKMLAAYLGVDRKDVF